MKSAPRYAACSVTEVMTFSRSGLRLPSVVYARGDTKLAFGTASENHDVIVRDRRRHLATVVHIEPTQRQYCVDLLDPRHHTRVPLFVVDHDGTDPHPARCRDLSGLLRLLQRGYYTPES